MVWAVLHLSGFLLGSALCSGREGTSIPEEWLDLARFTRVGALLPLVILLGNRYWQAAAWLGVLVLAMAGGSVENSGRQARLDVMGTGDCRPSERLQWTGPASVRITGWPSQGSDGDTWRAPALIVGWAGEDLPAQLAGPLPAEGIMIRGEGEQPRPGSLLAGRLTCAVPQCLRIPGGFDYRKFLSGRGLLWTGILETAALVQTQVERTSPPLKWLSGIRRGIVVELEEAFPTAEAALLKAVLLGIRTPDSRTLAEPFADLGLAHLFAVSGLHVGILTGIIYLPLYLLGFSPTARFAGMLVLLVLYAALTGMSGSVVRATGLAVTTLAALPLGGSRRPLHILGILFWLGMVWMPCQVLDAGNRLSYLAAGGILAVMAGGQSAKKSRPGRLVGWVSGGLTVSLSALWFTLPQVAASFGRLSALAPCANLFAVPLFGLGVWAAVTGLALGCCWPAGGDSLLALAWLILRFLAGVSGWLARHGPAWEIGLAVPGLWTGCWFILLTGLMLQARRRLSRRSGFVLLGPAILLAFLPILVMGFVAAGEPTPWSRKVRAWQFDVGQADCALLEFPDGWAALIDTGGKFGDGSIMKRSVAPFLRRRGRKVLDAVFLTHGHLDHTAGVGALLRRCRVDCWYAGGSADRALESWSRQEIRRPRAGEVLHAWGPWSLVCLQGEELAGMHLEENDRSLVIALLHENAAKMVWNGDLELAGERILQSSGFMAGPIQVWKAGHHGSSTSGSSGLLDSLIPKLTLISCGVGNRYGHPSHGPYLSLGDTLKSVRTDLSGTISLEWASSGSLSWETIVPPVRGGTLP